MTSIILPEQEWKERFVTRLAALFVIQGLDEDAAIADATAHGDEHYPNRGLGQPESDAEAVFESLKASMT